MQHWTLKNTGGFREDLTHFMQMEGHVFDHRISNEITSKDIETLIPIVTQTKGNAIFSIGSSTGIYLSGLSRASHLVIADWMPHITRFSILYLNLVCLLKSPQRIQKCLNESQDLGMLRKWLYQSCLESEKNILENTMTSRQTQLIKDDELLQALRNLEFHYDLQQSYLQDPQKLRHLIEMHAENRIQFITANALKPGMDQTIGNIFLSHIPVFSIFYLTNILEWSNNREYLQHRNNLNQWINALPLSDLAITIRSACRGMAHYQNSGAEIHASKGNWFYVINREQSETASLSRGRID